jgi:hypothetical protein
MRVSGVVGSGGNIFSLHHSEQNGRADDLSTPLMKQKSHLYPGGFD